MLKRVFTRFDLYRHRWLDGTSISGINGSPSKILCIARNYSEDESDRLIPVDRRMENAAIFLKPPTACVSMSNPIDLRGHTDVICETEVALLIGSGIARSKTGCSRSVAEAAVEGYTIAFDLTRKDLQTRLKNAGKPWELSKAFDGACPLGAFSKDSISRDATVELEVNGDIILSQPLTNMILSYTELIQLLSQYFTLCPGDVILTGTPTKPQLPPRLNSGDRLVASIGTRIRVETTAV